MRSARNAQLHLVFFLAGLGCAAVVAVGSCGLEVPVIGTPCRDGVDCPSGYACDPASSLCLPGNGEVDAGPRDAGPGDAGPNDAGPNDAGPNDAGPDDAGPIDGGPNDAGPTDAGTVACEEYVGADRPPVAFGTTVVVTAGAPATLQLAATDPDDATLSYALVSAEGVTADVTQSGGATVTTAAGGSFRFRATGAGGACSEERVDVVVVDPAGSDYRFVGAAGADWSDANSWEPNDGPPGLGASVYIPSGAVVDVDEPPTVGRLVVATGATLDLGLQTIAANDALVGGVITGIAPVKLRAVGGDVGGELPDLEVQGASTITRASTVNGTLSVTGGVLSVSAPLAVAGNFNTSNLGTLSQTTDVRIHVELAATFAGLRSDLTAGTFSVRGRFQEDVITVWGTFAGSGAHTLVLDGSARQLYNTPGADTNGRPNHVEVRGPVELVGNLLCAGDLRVRTGGSVDGPFTVDMPGRLLVDQDGTFSPQVYVLRNDPDVDGAYDVDTTWLVPALQLPLGLTLRGVGVSGGPVTVVGDTNLVGNLTVAASTTLVVQNATLTVQDLVVQDFGALGTALGTSRIVVLGNAALQPYLPETSLAAGSITFRGASVSLFNSGYGSTRGFGAVGHSWLFDAQGTAVLQKTTVLTSNITAQGCEDDRTRWCTSDPDCAVVPPLGACKTGGVWLRDVSVAPYTTLELGTDVSGGSGVVVLGDLTVPADAALILHEPLEALGGIDVAGDVTCDSSALSSLCP